MIQIDHETAIVNFELLKILPPNTKLYVSNDGKMCFDRRWFQGARRFAEGSSRNDIIQPLYQTFMRLVSRNQIPKEELSACLEHLRNTLCKVYTDNDDLNTLIDELEIYVKNCATSKDVLPPTHTPQQLESVEDALQSYNHTNIDLKKEPSDPTSINLKDSNVEMIYMLPQIDVYNIIEDARLEAERKANQRILLKDAFENIVNTLKETNFTIEECESYTEDLEITEECKIYSTECSEDLDSSDQSSEDDSEDFTDRIVESVENTLRYTVTAARESSNEIRRRVREHLDEVRIDIPSIPELLEFDAEPDCLQRLVSHIENASNSICSSFVEFLNDLAFTFGSSSNEYKNE